MTTTKCNQNFHKFSHNQTHSWKPQSFPSHTSTPKFSLGGKTKLSKNPISNKNLDIWSMMMFLTIHTLDLCSSSKNHSKLPHASWRMVLIMNLSSCYFSPTQNSELVGGILITIVYHLHLLNFVYQETPRSHMQWRWMLISRLHPFFLQAMRLLSLFTPRRIMIFSQAR